MLNKLTGNGKELRINRLSGVEARRTQTEARAPESAGSADDAPGMGVLVAATATLAAVIFLAGLPAAAGMTVLAGIPAPLSVAIALGAAAVISVVALAAAWVVARRRLAPASGSGIVADFD